MKLYLSIIIISILISHLIHQTLVLYSDESSFIWYRILSNRNQLFIENKHYDILVLGDSQILSGVDPKYWKDKSVLYSPRPSEQPEGIYSTLKILKSKNITYSKIILNISPLTVSDNYLSKSHKNLVKNFDSFNLNLYIDPVLRRYYFNTFSDSIYYLALQIFPTLKLNETIASELRFLPISKRVHHSKLDISNNLSDNFLGNLITRKEQNFILSKILEKNQYYWNWNDYTLEQSNCFPDSKIKELPTQIRSAFLKKRKFSVETWETIIKFVFEQKSKIIILYIPFSPYSEKLIQSTKDGTPFFMAITHLESKYGNPIIYRLDESVLEQSDYSDYIHPNHCGMKKIMQYIQYL